MVGSRSSRRSDRQREQQALAREAERQRRAEERARVASEKEHRRQYAEQRQREVDERNRQTQAEVERLGRVLRDGLRRSARIDLRADRRAAKLPQLDLRSVAPLVLRPEWEDFAPRPPGPLSRLFGGAGRYEQRLSDAKVHLERARQRFEQAEAVRLERVALARRKHEEHLSEVRKAVKRHNDAVDAAMRDLAERQKDAVEEYLLRVLSMVPLPPGFPRHAEIAYSPRGEQAVVRFELPPRDIVPVVAGYKYLPTKDEERSLARPSKDIGARYRDVVSQVALLCTRDLFDSDPALNAIGFNGHVRATNPATGAREYPCIISMNVERGDFPKDENLYQVDPAVCVRHLKAIVSNHPHELTPVEPILDFDLSKYSFVDGFDAVATLDSRPDLMAMSYTNFEHLVRQIFEAQGAEGWTTEQSNDDGVDAVIAKRTSLVGGLSIVQAKRWSKVVGISHVRELAGAIEEKKAGWGILVTTSWFTQKCWEKAREHGRMELIDGERLVYLIREHLGKDVVIGIPNRPDARSSSHNPNG